MEWQEFRCKGCLGVGRDQGGGFFANGWTMAESVSPGRRKCEVGGIIDTGHGAWVEEERNLLVLGFQFVGNAWVLPGVRIR
jgi:hypothetical protein